MNTALWGECEHLLRLVQAKQKISRNLDGVIAPGVFIDIVKGGSLDELLTWTESEVNDCIAKAFQFVLTTGHHHNNPYHNCAHFYEVHGRVGLMVWESLEEIFAANYAGITHDYDHHGKLISCGVDLGEVFEAYEGKYSMDDLRKAYEMLLFQLDNALIAEENCLLPLEKRKPMRQLFNDLGLLTLAPEEISGFHADANLVIYGERIGKPTPLRVRALVQCLIKASDFNNKRNFPKTPREWKFKMADMANFWKPITGWLKTAVSFGLEAPYGLPANVEKFVDGEIFFLEKMVKEPILDNPETDGLFRSWVYVNLQEKLTYLFNMKNEVERMKMGLRNREEASGNLQNFLEAIMPLFPNDSVDTIPLF